MAVTTSDISGFLASESDLIRDDHFFFTYEFETAGNAQLIAAGLCSEMSTAQWRRAGYPDEDFRPRFAAKLVQLEMLGELHQPSLPEPSGVLSKKYARYRVRIAYPLQNIGSRLPNLMTAAFGEGAFFSPGINSIKLMDIDFPAPFLADLRGPRFGIVGVRKLLRVYDRPLFFGVVKPNIGLAPEMFAELAYEAWLGGLDVAKDDEMLGDVAWSPLSERCRLMQKKRIEAEQRTGTPKLYLANITDEVSRLLSLHDQAVEFGAGMVMVNAQALGMSAVRLLAGHASVPVVAHFDCIAPMARHPHFGVAALVLTKLQRIVGCDVIIMPGFGPRMRMTDEEVMHNVDACASELGLVSPALPVPGGSDWAGTVPQMFSTLGHVDFGLVPGRGVFGHPDGPRAGAMSLKQAWAACLRGVSLDEYAISYPELASALRAFR